VNSAWHYHSHHELRPGLPCGPQRSPLAAAAPSRLCHKAASVVRGLMSKPRAPRTSVHAAPCCGIRTIFRSAHQGAVRREPYRSAKKSSRGCRPRASAQPVREPVALIAIGMIFGSDRKGNSDQMAHEWTAWLLGQPFRRWAVGAVGLGFLMTGAGVAVRGLQAKFKRQIEANKQKREVVTALGVAGFVARGFVFAMTCITATPADAADARSTTAGRWRPLQIRTAPRQPKAFPHLAAAAWRL
jgi:Domain of Unknown Function (DUF1206)